MTINCLSLSSINEKAPYHVWSANGISFSFQTETDVVYGVSFVEDHMISDDGDVMQLIISVNEGEASQKDFKIQSTVIAILEEFFKTGWATLVYICDTRDGRQSSRQRLFSIWFSLYPEKDKYVHEYKELQIDGIGYYMALLGRKDNPLLPEQLDSFEQLFQQISGKESNLSAV